MSTSNVKGIDIVVKKKPAGAITTISLQDDGHGWTVASVVGASADERQPMGEIGKLVAGLISGDIASATIQVAPGGKVIHVQCAKSANVVKSHSNVRNNW